MSDRKRFLILVAIMATACLSVAGFMLFSSYRTALDQTRERLHDTAVLNVCILESLAKFNREHQNKWHPSHGIPEATTIQEFVNANFKYELASRAMEVVIARLEGTEIKFMSRQTGDGISEFTNSISMNSPLADPMRRALLGQSGTMHGLDCSGKKVVAAYEPVKELSLGVVAKVDEAEILRPFIRTGIQGTFAVLLVIGIGFILYIKLCRPVLAEIKNQTQNLSNLRCQIAQETESRKTITDTMALYETKLSHHLNQRLFGVIEWDSNFEVIEWNLAAERIFGYTKEEALGKHAASLIVPESALPLVNDKWNELLLQTGGNHSVNENITKNGQVITCEWFNSPISDADGNFKSVLSIVHDVTDAKKAEDALKRSEEKYRLVVENSYDGIFILQDDVIKFPNRRVLKVFGYSAEELASHHFQRHIHPEYREMVVDRYTRRMRGEDVPNTYTIKVISKDGKEFWVQINATLVKWEGSYADLVFLRDITDQKKLEIQFVQAQKMEAVGRLAGGVAHDFNNLLTAILGNAELGLIGLKNDPAVVENLEEIKKAAHRASSLTRQLLAFSRKQVIEPMPLDLNIVVNGMEKMLRRMIGEDINLETFLSANLDVVKADAGQMEQILMNLVVNSRDAMSEGGKIIVETANVELDASYFNERGVAPQAGPYVMMSVTDTGMGIPKDLLSSIFEPFFTTKDKHKGTGLGLSTVYGIVKQNNGYVWAYSEPGIGTTFKVYLPKLENSANLNNEKRSANNTSELKQGGETVLVVEDDDHVRDITQKILQSGGYKVFGERNAHEAMAFSKAYGDAIDLLLIDVVLNGTNGRQLAEEMIQSRSTIKTLYMSGYTENSIVHNQILDASLAFIQKPFGPAALLSKVRNVLDETVGEIAA